MTTLTIEIPDQVEKSLSDLIEQLGGKIVSTVTSQKSDKKKQILNDLEASVKWVKLYQEGKVQAKSVEELLNKL